MEDTIDFIARISAGILLLGILLLTLTGCSGFQLGSLAYCAKEDNCVFQVVKPQKSANAGEQKRPGT